MTTRRDLLKLGSTLGFGAVLPALDALTSTETLSADLPAPDVTRDAHITGMLTMYDPSTQTLLQGEIALLSDGAMRAEIVLRNPDSAGEHRLRFTGPTYSPVVNGLITAMRDLYSATPVPVFPSCDLCGGLGILESRDGAWDDCADCAPQRQEA